MRKCKFSGWTKNNNNKYNEEGTFLQWASEADYDEKGKHLGNYTIALVEDNEGFVYKALPETIQFIN